MLKVQTPTGTVYHASLLEMCEDAAGPKAPVGIAVMHMAGVVQRMLELHPADQQTRALKPLIDAVRAATR